MKLLLTGACGFVGNALLQSLASEHTIVALSRKRPQSHLGAIKEQFSYDVEWLEGDLTDLSNIHTHLSDVQVVVHCAARVHKVVESAADPLAEYRTVNRDATLNLALASAKAGVKRFIFLSSVKVNGEFTLPGQPFHSSQAAPQDYYGISKWEAEIGLREIALSCDMEVVIIRPPLVYGPNVKANFLTMLRWLHRRVPLPLGAIHNKRSLVSLPNLVDFIELCLKHPNASNQTFMISDQHDLSTTELLLALGRALGRPARLLPVPQGLLESTLNLIGKAAIAQRLCSDLTVDSTPASELLGWSPPCTVQLALQATVDHFLSSIQG